jgi:transposase-like protein
MTVSKLKTKKPSVEALVSGDRDLMKGLLREALQEVLATEMTEFLGAGPGERSEERTGYRAGYYRRDLITRIGKLELRRGIATASSLLPYLNATNGARRRWSRRLLRCTCKGSPHAR